MTSPYAVVPAWVPQGPNGFAGLRVDSAAAAPAGVLMSPQGQPLQQQDLRRWAAITASWCCSAATYEGFDERIAPG